MPSHPPRSQPFRKAEILAKRIDELIHAIRHGYDVEKIRKAAEKVRFAQVKLRKGKTEQFRPFRTEDAQPNKAASIGMTNRRRRTRQAVTPLIDRCTC